MGTELFKLKLISSQEEIAIYGVRTGLYDNYGSEFLIYDEDNKSFCGWNPVFLSRLV